MTTRRFTSMAAAVLALFVSAEAHATNGYFVHGYGTHYKGMAGAGVALPLSSLVSATNPAGMVEVGQRYDLGIALFNPNRGYTVTGSPSGFPGTFGLAPGTVDSGSTLFPVPSFGANWVVSDRSTFGVAFYGHGGMNTDYDTPTFGFAPTGVDLQQMFVAPTYAIEILDNHAVGVTAVVAYQRFRAQGLAAFSPFSMDAASLTDNGYDSSLGVGARVGYLGKLSPYLSLGASYQTRTKMGELQKYQGLFAESGSFDIPSNWVVGVAVHPVERLDLLFDVHRMNYGEVPAVNNPLMPNLGMSQLGMVDGAGFGWQDVTAYKLGVQLRALERVTFRGGYSYADQPIPTTETLFNILAPGVMRHHATWPLVRRRRRQGDQLRSDPRLPQHRGGAERTRGPRRAVDRARHGSVGLRGRLFVRLRPLTIRHRCDGAARSRAASDPSTPGGRDRPVSGGSELDLPEGGRSRAGRARLPSRHSAPAPAGARRRAARDRR